MSSGHVVFGIDPGTVNCGWGVVSRRGSRLVHISHGVIRARRTDALPHRLRCIADGLCDAVATSGATCVALESAFVHRDVHAALVIGHARGVAMLVAAQANLEVAEYPPATVKKSIVGSGQAEKQQLNSMIRAILGLATAPPLDASDALAVAICHANRSTERALVASARAAGARSR